MATFWSELTATALSSLSSVPDPDPKSPASNPLLAMWGPAQEHDIHWAPSNIAKSQHGSDDGPKSRKRIRDPNNPRTKVACTCCYLSKSCCDQARPCGRCVRLNRPDQCHDRVHKKRTLQSGARSSLTSSGGGGGSGNRIRDKEVEERKAVAIPDGIYSRLTHRIPHLISVETMSHEFSQVLSDMWLYQCQIALAEGMATSDEAYGNAVKRICQVSESLVGGLVTAPVFAKIRDRLKGIGVDIGSGLSLPVFRPPFQLISAQQADEPESHPSSELNVAIIKSVQVPSLLTPPNPARGLYINDEAVRLFGYSAQELCDMFNRTSDDLAFTPFWTWIISQADWVNVIQHNSLFFMSQNQTSQSQGRSGAGDDTLIVTCVDKSGRSRKCLASTRSSVISPRSYSFCFIALGSGSDP